MNMLAASFLFILANAPATDEGRLDTSKAPGVVIAHSPAKSRQYIGSPSIAVLPSGEYVVSHDFFGPGSTREVTRVYASKDRGQTWTRRGEMKGQWWSTLFAHKGDLYILGTSKEYGSTVIRRSTDGGATWTEPKDAKSGVLHGDGKYHCAPVPVLIHNGRIWRAMEDAMGPGGWGTHFRAFMMSAPVDADLLDAASWTSSNRLGRDPKWLDGTFHGWLEGNAVLTPDGQVIDLLRVDGMHWPERAAIVRISPDGKTASFDPSRDFINMPGGAKKFTVRYDPESKRYWTLATAAAKPLLLKKPASIRNRLILMSSPDLREWTTHSTLIEHPEVIYHGFQYVDWLFDGPDLIAAVRTATDDGLGGAHNNHDANFLTFLRVKDFRK